MNTISINVINNKIVAGAVLLKESFTFTCMAIAPIISTANNTVAGKTNIGNQIPIIKHEAINNFEIPTIYINHAGKPYALNSFSIFFAPFPLYLVGLEKCIIQTLIRVIAMAICKK